jgi:membrane-associated phospholipid phosphatase
MVSERNRSAMLNTQSPHTVRTGLNRYAADFAIQLGLIFGAAIVYFGVRSATEGSVALANDHGHDVTRLESVLGIDVELQLQSLVLDSTTLSTLFNWVYIWGHWPAIAATLIWLHRRDNELFLRLRNALFISGAIGVVIFVLYPVTPPRLLDIGIVDTVTEQSNSYRVLQPPSLINKYAAVPSLHVGWNFLVGLALYRAAASRRVRLLGILSPIAMIAAVVLTGNHYVIDAAAGLLVASVGWIAAGKVQSLRRPIATWTPRPTIICNPGDAQSAATYCGERRH